MTASCSLTRESTTPWLYPEDRDHIARRVDQFRIDYLVIPHAEAASLTAQLSRDGMPVRGVWSNTDYRILKVIRPDQTRISGREGNHLVLVE